MSSIKESESLMRCTYIAMNGIDPQECVPIEGVLDNYEINLEGKVEGFRNFIEPRLQTVAIDHFSTKDINDEAIRLSSMPREIAAHYQKLYLEYQRFWAVVNYKNKAVGVANRLLVYNGYPGLTNLIELLEDADNAFNKILDRVESVNPNDFLRKKPEIYDRTFIALHRDFLANNPLRSKK